MTSSTSVPVRTDWKPTDKWLLGIVLAVINFWLFAQTLLNVIPGIKDQLGVEQTLANLAVSITSLFSGIFIVVAGGLADRIGRAKIMYIGIYLSILGSLLIALTPENLGGLTDFMLLGGRAIQGLSAACIMPSTMALIKSYYEGKDRQRALSFWSIGSWGGSGFCALFGGLMASSFLGWRSIFWISIVLSVLALFLLRGTPESRAAADPDTASHHFDWGGLACFIIMLVAINVYISQGPVIGWFSGAGLGLVAAFVVFGLLFLQIETRRSYSFVDLKLFSNGTFTGATLSNFLLNGAAGTLIVALGLVQVAAGMNSLQSGLLTLGYLIAILATIRVGEKLLQRFGPRKPMLWGSMITGIGILLCSTTFLRIGEYIVLDGHRVHALRHWPGLLRDPVHRCGPVQRPGCPGRRRVRHLQDGVLAGQRHRRGHFRCPVCGRPGGGPSNHPVLGPVHRTPGQRGAAVRRCRRVAVQRVHGGDRHRLDHPHRTVRAQQEGEGRPARRSRSAALRQLSR